MIDFKQMTDDEQTAMAACEEWSNGEPAVTTQEEELSFKEGFKRGLRHERKKWQKFKWRNPLEKPEPDSYIIAAEDVGCGEYEYIAGTYIADSDPWISNAQIVPDDHACIPEADRKPADERKDYFKVQVRREWVEDMKLKKSDTYYIVAANDVGQAKERIALLLDILKAEQEKEQGFKVEDDSRTTIRKAMPFEVDCIVPKEFSDMFHEEPTKV